MNAYINGDIYIKRNPSIFHVNEHPLINDLMRLTDDLIKHTDSEEVDELVVVKNNFIGKMKDKEGTNDYSECGTFYRLATDGDEIELRSTDNRTFDVVLNSFDILDNEYESLSDFLDTAEYVGKYIKIDSLIANYIGLKRLCLYKKGSNMICKDTYLNSCESYCIDSSDIILNDELEYDGEKSIEYDDRNFVYREILKQYNEGLGRIL